ncbi:MAG: response regulator [Rhodospirillales bacterium]|nr:MAG: response regulator [Rhodospirillales bacterium]
MSFASGKSIQASVVRSAHALERLNCMIIDDNRHMRSLLKGVLRAFGIRHVSEVADAPEAINELKSMPIDLLITEYALDTLDGNDLTKLIRTGSDSTNPLIPIIMLTGHTERFVVSRARDVGVNEFLAKPISAEALYGRIIGTLFNPRQFVKAKTYFGPDRRRRTSKRFAGTEHRTSPPEFIQIQPWVIDDKHESEFVDQFSL